MRLATGAFIVLLGILAGVQGCRREAATQDAAATPGSGVQAPYFEVDPLWPMPLPNHWLLGSAIGVAVDDRDHVWIFHRGSSTLDDNEKGLELTPPRGTCCAGAPPVLEFDAAGTLVNSWGGPGEGYEWPASNHGITVDAGGNVWIGGNGPQDAQALKFTRDGKFLLQVGKSNARRGPDNAAGEPTYVGGSSDREAFGRVAKIFVDPMENEAYLADGYLNKRVAVIDADTGVLKRFWGAYGNPPEDRNLGPYEPGAPPAEQFRNPVHCADLSVDRLFYVCDRVNNRLQVFRTDGTFVKEAAFAKGTLGAGAVWDIAFSKDPQQTYVYLADGLNMQVRVVLRDTLEELTSFGDGGRQPGQFFGVHSIATDSQGNIYTTETYEGKRLQKFVYRGLRAVTRQQQGTVWPQ
jgi:DNA-binding beta-propeller fold protein YncE